jgi:integrase
MDGKGSQPRPRVYLPQQEWPHADFEAWEALFTPGDIFDGAGAALHWSPATRKTNAHHYARWLGWLDQQANLDPRQAPWERASPEAVNAYAQHLIATVAPRTAASSLIGLKVVMKAMRPDLSWRWLMDLTNRLHVWAEPSVDRRGQLRPVDEIHQIARAELDRLLKTPMTRRRERVGYRNAMLILILSVCPIRLRNLASIEIGTHLLRKREDWVLRFSEEETKNGQRLTYVLPRAVDRYLDAYLAHVRSSFCSASSSQAFWLSYEGGKLSYHSIYCEIIRTTRRLFGHSINPHSFRSCAATSLVEAAPDKARLAAPLLGHRYFQTTERYYVRAGQIDASRKVAAILDGFAGIDYGDVSHEPRRDLRPLLNRPAERTFDRGSGRSVPLLRGPRAARGRPGV